MVDEPPRRKTEDDRGKGQAKSGVRENDESSRFTRARARVEFFARGWLIGVFARSSRDPDRVSAAEDGETRGCAVSVNYALTIGLRFNYIDQELGGSAVREVGTRCYVLA